jgi:Asp/Glu/hydantoin racemase
MIRIALINPNTDVAVTDRMLSICRAAAPLDVEFVGLTAATGASVITNEAQLAAARLAVLQLVPRLHDGFHGAIVAAFGDPALAELSAELEIPVVGIGETSLREAARDGRRFCVVTTTPDLADSIGRAAAALGLAERFAGVVLTESDALAVASQPDRLLRELEAAIERAVDERKVSAVVIGGGPLAAAARSLAVRKSVVVIEPVPLAASRIVDWIGERLARNDYK